MSLPLTKMDHHGDGGGGGAADVVGVVVVVHVNDFDSDLTLLVSYTSYILFSDLSSSEVVF